MTGGSATNPLLALAEGDPMATSDSPPDHKGHINVLTELVVLDS